MPHFKIILSAALLTITACAPLDPREGFDDIKSLAEKKINSNLIWNADQEAAD